MDLNPALEPLRGLIGTWVGTGHGVYPTITGFAYADEWTFTDLGKPFLHVLERTRIDGVPMHTETGYLRLPESGPELVMAIPTGQSEISEGSLTTDADGVTTLRLAGDVQCTTSAKQVDRIERVFAWSGDDLTYEMHMAAVGQPLQTHLRAVLSRQIT